MNAARMGVLVLAVVAAGLAALLARGLMGPSEDKPKEASIASTDVLVASTDIERGRRLTAGDLRWQSWPSGTMTPNFITRASRPDADTALVNNLARQPMANGEPIMESKLIDPQKGGLMSALVSPGMRAVAVIISPETGAGGFILPNDRVDVILSRRARRDTDTGRTEEGFRGETILSNVRVLAIDQAFQVEGNSSVLIGKTATLELTASQAETLIVGQTQASKDSGALSLSLRSLSDNGQQVAETKDNSEANVVRVVRFGVEDTVRVK